MCAQGGTAIIGQCHCPERRYGDFHHNIVKTEEKVPMIYEP